MNNLFNKSEKTFILLAIVVVLVGGIYGIVRAYSEPYGSSASPLAPLDVGPLNQTKSGNLSVVSSLGTTTLSGGSIFFDNAVGSMGVEKISGSPLPVVGYNGKTYPIGFMWKNSGSGISTPNNVSIGTSTSYGSLTITNGTALSSAVNFTTIGSTSTFSVGAYYDSSAGVWKALNPVNDTSSQPMAVSFSPNSGVMLRAGATAPDASGAIYWKNSMSVDLQGDVTFSNLYATSSYMQWDQEKTYSSLTTMQGERKGSVEHPVSEYCDAAVQKYGGNFSTYCAVGQNGNDYIVNLKYPIPAKNCTQGSYIYFYPYPEAGSDMYANYMCDVGTNNPSNNTAQLTVGNLFVANQDYAANSILGDVPGVDTWAQCPSGYLMSGVWDGGVQCSKF